MNKRDFLIRLRQELSGLPQDDVEERLAFYAEMIDDRMEDGLEETEAMPQVLQLTTFKKLGDEISRTNSLDRVIYRLHVMDDTPEALAATLEKISHTLCILDETGREMQVERLGYGRALEMIRNS